MEAESSLASKPALTSRDGSSPSLPILTPTQTNPKPVLTKSDWLPDPPLFNSKQKDLPAFLRKLRYKLEGNSDQFPSKRSRLLYAHSCLDRDVVTLIDSLIDKDISRVNQFVAFLEATYRDLNKEMTALSKINTLK
jgi:methylaspartate ammonia-lyase